LAHDKTVLLSTHILQEVEAVADRIVIINAGRIVGDGTLEELRQRAQRYEHVLLSVAAPREAVDTTLRQLPQVRRVRYAQGTDGFTHCEIDAALGTQLARHLGTLVQSQGWKIDTLAPRAPTLEETFLALTEPQDVNATQGAKSV
jgi:ABC-2 type transport system ATP-binding protein